MKIAWKIEILEKLMTLTVCVFAFLLFSYIYGELADCYKQIGDNKKAQYYINLFNN